eukprot:jgi/Mesvir1/5192/Mv15325-RA.1
MAASLSYASSGLVCRSSLAAYFAKSRPCSDSAGAKRNPKLIAKSSFVPSLPHSLVLAARSHNNVSGTKPQSTRAAQSAVAGNLLEKLHEVSFLVPDTFALDDFSKYMPEAAVVNSRAVLYAVDHDPKYNTLMFKALSFNQTGLENEPSERFDRLQAKVFVAFGAAMAKKVDGRVVTEIDRSCLGDTAEIVRRAKYTIKLYEMEGVPKNKVLMQIPGTPEGIDAVRVLEAEGIQCQVNQVFSLAQAMAAAQAGASVISPMAARVSEWATRHGGSPNAGTQLVRDAFNYVHKYGKKAKIMVSSVRTKEQALAVAGCDFMILGPRLLDQLFEEKQDANLKPVLTIEGAKASNLPDIPMDAAALRKALAQDPAATELVKEHTKQKEKEDANLRQYMQRCWPPPSF